MGFRFRKSFGPKALRVTVGKRGVGLSTGVRGLRYGVHSSGRRTRTVTLPGTGISHVETSRGKAGGGWLAVLAALGAGFAATRRRRR